MSMKDMKKMKKFLDETRSKGAVLPVEKKIGSGAVEKMHKNIGLDYTRTKKISQ